MAGWRGCLITGLMALVVAAGCGGGREAQSSSDRQPAADADPRFLTGLHASDLTTRVRERGLQCKEPTLERDTTHWVCETSTPLTAYFVEFYGKAPGRLELLRVVVTQSGEAKEAIALPLLGYFAGLKYQGADPAKARAWIETSVAARGETAQMRIGLAKYKLSGDLSRLVLEIKAAGSDW